MGRRGPGAAAILLVVVALGAVPSAAAAAPAESGSSDWRQVSAGGAHTCGIRTTGRLYCWGADDSGQLGDAGANTSRPVPRLVAGGSTWRQVSAGSGHTCGIRTTGRLYCWGSDADGALGNGGTNADQPVPVEVAGGATNWTTVSAGAAITCARRATGRLYCWGNDDDGALGDGGTNVDRARPRLVAGGATDWTAVSVGVRHTCARRATGRLYCWGSDDDGELGDGAGPSASGVPVLVAGGARNWTAVAVGSRHTCARRATGRLYCWGDDDGGQLGNGAATGARFVPVLVAGGATDWAAVTAGAGHTCGRRATGRLFCWGPDILGELGDGDPTLGIDAPSEVDGGATDWTAVDGGGLHTCARIRSGRLYCWGDDTEGELGDNAPGTTAASPVPVWA